MFKKALFTVAMLAQMALFADTSQGEVLEKQMWQYIKEKKWDDLEKHLASCFQAGLNEGARSKEQYITRAKVLNISEYTLSNFHVTQSPGLFVVSYDLQTSETIEGNRISSKAPRLSVWQNNNGIWQWVAHAVLIPMPV